MKNTSNRRESAYKYLCRVVRVLVVVSFALMLVAPPVAAQTNASETNPCEYGPPVPSELSSGNASLEAALTFDTSQSMDAGTRIEDARAAGKTFVGHLESPQEVAISEFQGGSASLEQPLTTNYAAANNSIDGLITDGSGTDFQFAEGINLTTEELVNGTEATVGANKVMIIFTDTGNTPQSAVDAADYARTQGITIYAIGIGDSVDEAFLADLAGDSSRVYVAPSSSELDSLIEEVSSDVLSGELRVETRDLFLPGSTHPYRVYNVTYGLEDNETVIVDREEVTDAAHVSTTNSTVLSVNPNSTLSASSDANMSTWVRVDATYNGSSGCTNAIVAEPTIQNFQLIPGVWRFVAVANDSTLFALLIATLLAVPAARFTSAFGGLAVGEMVLVIGWLGGYVGFGIAAASVFVSLFIGLNLAANIDYMAGGGR